MGVKTWGVVALMLAGSTVKAEAPDCDKIKRQAIEARGRCSGSRQDECMRSRNLEAQFRQCYNDAQRESMRQMNQRDEEQRHRQFEEMKKESAERQQAKRDAEAEHANRINAIKGDRSKMAIVFGAALCFAKRIRSESLAEAAKEKKYASIGGVFNKDKMYQLQQRIRWADEADAIYRKKLTLWHGLTAASCGNATVKDVVQCKIDGDCSGDTSTYAEFVDDAPDVDD